VGSLGQALSYLLWPSIVRMKSGNRQWRMENEEWMFEECFYESRSQYNWASLYAVGEVRPDRLISARLRRKFSTAFSSNQLFTTRSSTEDHGIYGKAVVPILGKVPYGTEVLARRVIHEPAKCG
jgi:hypothetical protein